MHTPINLYCFFHLILFKIQIEHVAHERVLVYVARVRYNPLCNAYWNCSIYCGDSAIFFALPDQARS